MIQKKPSPTNEALEYGKRLPANHIVLYPRRGLAAELRRKGNDVVEVDDNMLICNQTAGPMSMDHKAMMSIRRD